MKKEGLFVVLAILAVGSIFFSFIGSMNYSGNVVKDVDCSLAMNKFESSKSSFDCEDGDNSGIYTEICKKNDEIMIYEYSLGEYKKWSFIEKDGTREEYVYDLSSKNCEKR